MKMSLLRSSRGVDGWKLSHLLPRLLLLGKTVLLLLDDGGLDALPLGERDERLGGLADDEHVRATGGEGLAGGILDVNDVERTSVTLTRLHQTNATDVATSSDHAEVAGFELDVVNDLALQIANNNRQRAASH